MRPQPTRLSGTWVPVIVLLPELTIMAFMSAAVGVNPLPATLPPVGYQPSVRYWRISAAQPVAAGQAIEVPLSGAYVESPVVAEVTLTPGATMVGLRRLSCVGPRLEKPASEFSEVLFPLAPTPTQSLDTAGEPTVPRPIVPALPFEYSSRKSG